MKSTLLDLDHTPTLEELRAFFKANDFSSARYYDDENLSYEQISDINEVANVFKDGWDKLAEDKGLRSKAKYYSDDNSLQQMRNSFAALAGQGVNKLIEEQPEKAEEILTQFSDILGDEEETDNFFNNSIDTLMATVDFEALTDVMKHQATHEDFNETQSNEKIDFIRKFYHTRTGITIESIADLDKNLPYIGPSVENQAIYNITKEEYWKSLSKEDAELLRYSMSGLTQKEIADKLGYKTHSAVSKRLDKLKSGFISYMKN